MENYTYVYTSSTIKTSHSLLHTCFNSLNRTSVFDSLGAIVDHFRYPLVGQLFNIHVKYTTMYIHVCNIVLLYMLCVCAHTLNFVVGLLYLGVQTVCPLVPAHTCINLSK